MIQEADQGRSGPSPERHLDPVHTWRAPSGNYAWKNAMQNRDL